MIALIDVGGTKLAAAAAEGDALEGVVRRETARTDPVGQLVALIEAVRDARSVDAVSLSVPGPFDREAGALRDPPGLPPAWHGLDLCAALTDRYGCPVLVENDANCAGLAEARAGAGRGISLVVYFTVSTGVGTGVVRDGRVWYGRHDTEGGHQVVWPEWTGGPRCHCGGAGCLEALASGTAIERRHGVRGELLEDQEAWDDVGRWLGLGAVNAIALHDPGAILFGGGVCASWERFAPALHATVAEHVRLQSVPVVARGSLGEERNLLGALALAADALRAG